MNFEIAGLILVFITVGLIFAFALFHKGRPYRDLRAIPAFDRLHQAINLAVEDGSRLHISLGSASPLSPQGASALAGLTVLRQIAEVSSSSDRPPVVTTGDPALAILSQDTLRASYQATNTLDQFDLTQGRLTGFTPFSYAAGTLSVFHEEQVSANLLAGNFGAEVGLMNDAAQQENEVLVAGSDSVTGQALMYMTAQEPLIGEELFAGGAYFQAGPLHAASLHAEDILRWIVIVTILGGSILKLLQSIGIL